MAELEVARQIFALPRPLQVALSLEEVVVAAAAPWMAARVAD